MDLHKPPPKAPSDVNALRGTTLGQMHYGEMQTHAAHPALRKFIRFSLVTNVLCFIILLLLFTLKTLFPPYEASFKWAIGSYFIFGAVYAVFSAFFFKFARFVEDNAIRKAITHNRRYEWHSTYDTKNMTDEDLKKKPEAVQATTASQAVNAGANYFRLTGFLALASLVTCGIGIWTLLGEIG